MNWHEYVNATGKVPEWPYPVRYEKENIVTSDVLIIGGGVAGCRAAISARQRGARVVVADRGFTKRSGSGGAGVDHWHGAVRNPCSKVTPRMYSEAAMATTDGYTNGLVRYIVGKEGWDTLLETEQMGVQIRDETDEFKGSMFRDEETKLLFAYDLENKHCLRIYGANIKPCVDREMRRVGCDVYERICVTSLLTEGGKKGARVIGATGVHDRTGEFYIFKAKSVIVSTGKTQRLWCFAPELRESQSMYNLDQSGMGHTIGWRAGAEFVLMEMTGPVELTGTGYAPYSTGNNNNTYQGVSVVDKNGKVVKYADAYGNLIDTEEGIFKPSQEGSFFIGWGIALDHERMPAHRINLTDPNLWEKVRAGEYEQPFYTDMTSLSKTSRDIIWRLMLAHEGKCRVPIYEQFTAWGFDPKKHLLQFPVGDYSLWSIDCAWANPQSGPANWRAGNGGYLIDWRLRTTLPGLFVAGDGPIASQGCHGESQTAGRYAGRQAAIFARDIDAIEPDPEQIAAEKARCYMPTKAKGDIGWKELNYAVARIMQDYCGEYKTEHTLDMGIRRMKDLLETEGKRMYVSNPHELARALESLSLCELGVAYMEGAKARKASNKVLGFYRYDYPEDTEEWHKLVAIKQTAADAVASRGLAVDYHLQAPYAPDLEDNYQRYSESDR
ncbi:MAG: FAD-dependent oxidoreductase [Clostridiales Family XIII bacterium]|jgi:succinate dehydrogenase/fumarate reductase flavoprotein subunit|nr:FAD-dependent oxidoreductase [Clostridiales Family XIII bacterium]